MNFIPKILFCILIFSVSYTSANPIGYSIRTAGYCSSVLIFNTLKLCFMTINKIAHIPAMLNSLKSSKDQTTDSLEDFNPDNTIFAFDLHDVLLFGDHNKMLKLFWYETPITILPIIINPVAMYKLVRLIKTKKIDELIFQGLAEHYPSIKSLENLFLQVNNCQKIDFKIIDLIKKLKDDGYKIYVLSNIGEKSLKYISQKEAEVFDLFDGYYTPSEKNSYVRKPKTEFYNGFKEYLVAQKDNNKNIIFIDDLKKNIKSANELGFHGIIFKSPDQLRKQLIKWKILS